VSGWIKLHRSLIDWEWYDDHNATRLLVHLLISVNYEDKKWKGQVIKAGSVVLSWDTLAAAIYLSPQQVRTAMAKLESSGEVTRQITNRYQLVTLVKWEDLQSKEVIDNRQSNRQITGKQQADNRQITPTKEEKESKEPKEDKKKEVHPPDLKEFLEYANEKCEVLNYNYCEQKTKGKFLAWQENNWVNGNGRKIKNWKTSLLNTLPHIQQEKGSAQKENGLDVLREFNRRAKENEHLNTYE